MRKIFDFSKYKLQFLLLPILVVVLGIVMYFVHGGFNFDVEFLGGIRMQVEIGQDFNNDDISDIVTEATGLEAVVQKSGATGQTAVIKIPAAGEDDSGEQNKDAVFSALKDKYSLNDEALLNVQSSSPSFGAQVQQKALSYTLLAILCMLVYIIIRFDWRSAIMAVITLALNVLVMASVYTITNIALNTTFIAAMLTVIGYCINNTIVIFDRVRENMKSHRSSESITALANRSIQETLGRTISSTVTTLITIVMIYILGVSTIKQFALPLIIGIVVGAYTSIFIAATYWAAWKEAEAKSKANAAANKKTAKKK